MTPDTAAQRIATLTAEIRRHDELYRNRARPEIGDFEYDALKRELEALERQFPSLMVPDSPTQRVGDDRAEGFLRTKHRLAMTTLDNTYDEGELRDFHARLAKLFGRDDLVYSVEPKIDGASISVTYENGKLVRAVTRGDGEAGDDVTANVKTIAHLPHTLRAPTDLTEPPVPALVEIRGEIFLRFSEFARINQTQEEAGLEPYANPRNLAAGTLKLLDAAEVRARGLEIVLYGFGAVEPQGLLASQSAGHAALAAWGLPTLEHRRTVRGLEAVVAAIRELDAHRATLPYATDGAVVKLDDFALQHQAGFRGEGQSARKLSPRWACAYKFAPERAETRLKAITIQVGRTGVLTPVAELEPVQLAGTTVARATLHNRDEIARKDIRVGDTVYVEKAGEIIPVVVAVNLARRTPECAAYDFPETCPVCATATVHVAGEVAIRCPNPDCAAQLVGRLDYVAGRGVLDLEGLGGVVAERLVATGAVAEFYDIFQLEASQLARLIIDENRYALKSGGLGKQRELGLKNARKICHAIHQSKTLSLARWIAAMQITGVGSSIAQDLAKLSRDMEGFYLAKAAHDTVRLDDLLLEIQRTNPRAAINRDASNADREQFRILNDEKKKEADELGEQMIAAGFAIRGERPLSEIEILGDSPEVKIFQSLLQKIKGIELEDVAGQAHQVEISPDGKLDVKLFRRQADELARDMVKRGIAKISHKPSREALTILGPTVARAVINWCTSARGLHFKRRLKDLGINPITEHRNEISGPLAGKAIVVTGSILGMSRIDVHQLVHRLGGTAASEVSKTTSFLVVGDNPGSKVAKAQSLGVKIINFNELISMTSLNLEKFIARQEVQGELL